MAAMFAMLETSIVRVGVTSARAKRPRCTFVQFVLAVDEFVVEYTSTESTHAHANARASLESAESLEFKRQIDRQLIRG